MGHQLVCRAAVDGKPLVSRPDRTSYVFVFTRRLTFSVAAFFLGILVSSTCHAQSGLFAGMAGKWAGGGTVTLDDGSSERVRCRAIYQITGSSMDMSLMCASDAYKFNLLASVADQGGGAVAGTWSETSRNVGGSISGKGGGGNFQVDAVAAGFNANISLRTSGNKQSIALRADSQFRAANISLSK